MTDNSQRPPTAQEYVLQRLRQAIISRELQPGAAIRQELLAQGIVLEDKPGGVTVWRKA